MIVFTIFAIFAILACLGIGIFALLNWQIVPVVWVQSIVFGFGCLALVLAGALIVALIVFINVSKGE